MKIEPNLDNIPQGIKEWKKSVEEEIKRLSFKHEGDVVIKVPIAIEYMRVCFTKGFKTARRNRTALAEHILREIDRKYNVNPKEPKS